MLSTIGKNINEALLDFFLKLTKIPHKKQTLTYLLGVCVPSNKYNAAKIRVRRLEFDDYLSMHFPGVSFAPR